jgi:hypothetical protein
MTTPRGFILPLLFLFILVNVATAVCPSAYDDYSKVNINPYSDSGRYQVSVMVKQDERVCTYGIPSNNLINDGDVGWLGFLMQNGTGIGETIVVYTQNFTWSCYNAGKSCWASFDWWGDYAGTLPGSQGKHTNYSYTTCSNLLFGWAGGTNAFGNNCSVGYTNTKLVASHGITINYDHAGYQSTTPASGSPEICIVESKVTNSSCFNAAGCLFPNSAPNVCIECTSGNLKCDVMGENPANGHSFVCSDAGHWVSHLECESGGWQECGLSSVLDCPGASTTVSIANKDRVPERISLTDNIGRILLWTGNGYRLFSGQTIQETAFVFIDNYTKGDWKLTDDAVSVVYSWNATEMGCSKTLGSQGYSSGSAFYVDNSDYNCSLKPGYSTSNITISITANLTTVGLTVVRNPLLTKTFNVELVNDVALLDNLQAIYVNGTHFAFSGHIIRLSDLSEIPEASSPFATFAYSVYSNTSSTTLVDSDVSGVLNATDANALYSFVNSSGQGIGSLVRYTAVVGASGYANSSYYLDSAYISPLRIVYFKCRNVPKSTNASTTMIIPGGFKFTMGLQTWYYDATKTSLFSEPVRFLCQYKLENASAILPSTLGIQSTISKSNDVGSDTVTTGFFEFTIVNSSSSPVYAYSSNVEVPFSHAIGIEIFNELDQAFYTKFDSAGNPEKLEAGRYVGRWAILDNPVFYQVKTYVDLVINNENPLGTSFNFISFNQTVYNEGDNVLCSVSYDDVNGLIQNWAIDISGDSGFVQSINDASNTSCVSSQTTSCVYATPISCGKTIGESPRVCMIQTGIYGIQECTSRLNNSDLTSACLSYKNKFFNGGGDKTLTCTVRLYEASGVGGKVIIQTAIATVFVNSEDLVSSLLKGISWQWWILIIIALIIGLLLLKWRLQGGRKG